MYLILRTSSRRSSTLSCTPCEDKLDHLQCTDVTRSSQNKLYLQETDDPDEDSTSYMATHAVSMDSDSDMSRSSSRRLSSGDGRYDPALARQTFMSKLFDADPSGVAIQTRASGSCASCNNYKNARATDVALRLLNLLSRTFLP